MDSSCCYSEREAESGGWAVSVCRSFWVRNNTPWPKQKAASDLPTSLKPTAIPRDPPDAIYRTASSRGPSQE